MGTPRAIRPSAFGNRVPISFPDHVLRSAKDNLRIPLGPYGTYEAVE